MTSEKTATPPPAEQTTTTPRTPWPLRLLQGLIALLIGAVIAAPIILSSADLYRWATSPEGLGLDAWQAVLVFIALDAAASVCVGMSVLAAWHGEHALIFDLLTFGFAGASAYANRQHALTTSAAGDDWFMPACSIGGPVLLHLILFVVRQRIRKTTKRQMAGWPRFGPRWLVSPLSTLEAWKLGVREGISDPQECLTILEARARAHAATTHDDFILRRFENDGPAAAAYAAAVLAELGSGGEVAVRRWLVGHRIIVTADDLAAAGIGAAAAAPVRPGRQRKPDKRQPPETAAADADGGGGSDQVEDRQEADLAVAALQVEFGKLPPNYQRKVAALGAAISLGPTEDDHLRGVAGITGASERSVRLFNQLRRIAEGYVEHKIPLPEDVEPQAAELGPQTEPRADEPGVLVGAGASA